MSNPETAMRVTGSWLVVGAVLLAVALFFHGPPSPLLDEQMKIVAEGASRWSFVHWVAAAALSSLAIAGLIALASGSRLTAGGLIMSAWAVLSVGALWTVTTAVAEATVVTQAATSGNQELFAAWWNFSEGKANGFVALAVAVLVIAATEAQNADGVKPAWVAWIGVAVAAGSVVGWILNSWLDIGIGGPIWVISSLAMSLWLLWFGMMLVRTKTK